MNIFKRFISVSLILVSLVFTGCEKTQPGSIPLPPPPSRTYSNKEMSDSMRYNGIYATSTATVDAKYVLTTKEWVTRDFSQGLAAFQFQMGINNWTAESNDCDKFSLATMFYAKWLSFSSKNRNVNASLGMGEVFYMKTGLGGHAINFFIFKEQDGSLMVHFYEPQTRTFVTLSDVERSSIFFWRL